jgi:transcriptional regulator with XRE-family HTH domain
MLEWARKRARYSEDLLARKIGVPVRTYEEWESGRSTPTLRELRKLALFLRCPVMVFLCLGALNA